MKSLIKQQSLGNTCNLQIVLKNDDQTLKIDVETPIINIHSLCLISEIENSKISYSNYRSFLQKWSQSKIYPLPECFNLISIPDLSSQFQGNQYEMFNFNIMGYNGKQLCEAACKIILSNGFDTLCSPVLVKELVQEIFVRYNIVSYHNFSHGFSLMHMLYQLTKLDPNFKEVFSLQQMGYCFIAALAHDINHPGTNNGFQIKIKSGKAIEAKNDAVLEKMHARQFFNLIGQKNLNIFQKSSNQLKMKQLIMQVILATDVSKHFKNLQKLKELNVVKQPESIIKNKYLYMQQVFHACDIGNPCLQFQQYINWAFLLTYQFNTQTLLEAQQNVEVTQMFKYKNLKGFYQGQIGFINALVFPLWKQLAFIWPGFNLLTNNVQKNLECLKNKIDEQNQTND